MTFTSLQKSAYAVLGINCSHIILPFTLCVTMYPHSLLKTPAFDIKLLFIYYSPRYKR